MKRLLLSGAIAFALIISQTGLAAEPYQYVPLPSTAFVEIFPQDFPHPTPTPTPIPTPTPKLTPAPTKKPVDPKPVAHVGYTSGTATWYCWAGISVCHYKYPDLRGIQFYAAAGPKVRALLGPNWRNKAVTVETKTGFTVTVYLIDWCACGGDHIIDLYHDVFVYLTKMSHGNPNPVKVYK